MKCGFGRIASAGCANPDNDPRGPWCYTSFATKDNWEYCHQICARHDVCAQRPQNNLPSSSENERKCTETIDGIPCRNWSESVNMSDRPATQRWMRTQDNNFCANPDNDTKGNWCFTDAPRRSAFSSTDNYGYCAKTCLSDNIQPTRQTTQRWTRPTVWTTTPTPSTTITTTSRPAFAERICSETIDGRRCRNWQKSINMSTQESTRSWMRSQNNNFCANPDNDPKGAWCFAEGSFGSNNYGYCPSDCGSRFGATTISTTSRTTQTRQTPFRWTTRRQTTTRRSPERLAPVRVSSTNNKPICAPMNDVPFYFRDDDGEERRPDVWEQPDEIPGQNRDDRFRSEPRKALRILEGNEAAVGQIPWQVQLIGRSACGGTIVAPRIVVTAQHCLENAMDPRRWMVQAGHVQKNSRGSGAQKRAVIKILNTGNYNSPRKHNNDIAIMVTDEPFQFNHLVKPACLPPKNFKPIGGECIISGWGHTSYRGRSSNELLWTLVPLIPRNFCGRQLRERLTGNMICGGGSGPDTCQGDSGGPLVCALRHSSGEKQYTLVGITSFGNGCGNTPGVYTEVADYIDWIHQIISEFP